MSKNIILLFFFFFSFNAIAQTDFDLDLNTKKEFISIKTLNKEKRKNIKDYIILDNDTLVNSNRALLFDNNQQFCEYYKSNEYFNNYNAAVSYELLKKSDRIAVSKQWNSEIFVYLDKSIPKKLRKKFTSFFKQIDSINNFKLSFSKSIDQANYVIKVSDSTITNYKTDTREYDETYTYSRIKCNLLRDKDNKIYGAITLVDASLLNNKPLMLKKLKQIFFISTGQFNQVNFAPSESLLSPDYIDSIKIAEFDINFLKTHYFKIYSRPFNKLDAFKLSKKAKSICNNE